MTDVVQQTNGNGGSIPAGKFSAGPESAISGAIWKKQGKFGEFYSCTINRTWYKGDESQRSTLTFSRKHIPAIRMVLDQIEEATAGQKDELAEAA